MIKEDILQKMIRSKFFKSLIVPAAFALWGMSAAGDVELTFADLSVLIAKQYFSKNVSSSASLEQCAAFLNSEGIRVSLFDVMSRGKSVPREEFARMMGQATLIFTGEAAADDNGIKKPSGIDTWVDYCELNDISLDRLWNDFSQRVKDCPLREVQSFFGSSPAIGDRK